MPTTIAAHRWLMTAPNAQLVRADFTAAPGPGEVVVAVATGTLPADIGDPAHQAVLQWFSVVVESSRIGVRNRNWMETNPPDAVRRPTNRFTRSHRQAGPSSGSGASFHRIRLSNTRGKSS